MLTKDFTDVIGFCTGYGNINITRHCRSGVVTGSITSTIDKGHENSRFAIAMDAMESTLLALACAGKLNHDVQTAQAIETAIESIANHTT